MTYRCNDCSLIRRGRFPGGKCPACGSFNVERLDRAPTEEQPGGKPWRLMFLVALWVLLAYLIYRKF